MLDAALESLSEHECLSLLKSVKYGRVAVVTKQGRPEIFPVKYRVHDRTVGVNSFTAPPSARRPGPGGRAAKA
jgi:nitroimidazol reductase NimA-like FMN-containing flavoprotein (pyridoxamine 5'-phosphate oxidase superfamily)